jgi:hypothetical protein
MADHAQPPAPKGRSDEHADRAARLAAALRANLARRKAQAQARARATDGVKPATPEATKD